MLGDEYDIPSHRQTIKADIELLQQFGMDIQEAKSTQSLRGGAHQVRKPAGAAGSKAALN